ncbi:BadF/BadG/BcrA/BcrD ATPase family protein [Meridianimarinicoccus aquatilis]|uniref:ATPase n=1 Tax=Meridianimarinicoccus aquatilis TaxID=2552766 RepID=A0A4R6B2K4_9RHOB|nr:BadF/BadG/BcrA/BcrD ATPase family protein [Fluviibacterium aquatile]TDL90384.1 ATPase [Fluviibacterium aquatile]
MHIPSSSCLIGIDGGGTACRIALVSAGRRTDLRVASANVHSDPVGAVATIVDGLTQIADQAGLGRECLSRATGVFGLAGVTGARVAGKIAAQMPLGQVKVVEDCVPAIVGALGEEDGVVAGLGTGSFFGRQSGGIVDLRGGWGFLLGDEASGAWLGRALLARVLHVHDGLYPATGLTREILARFEDGTSSILDFAGSARPSDYAAFAPEIVKAASNKDATALDLMQTGAEHVVRAIEALGWRAEEPICLMGGLADHYDAYLPARMSAALVPAKASALDGALQMAAQWAEAEGA